MLEFRLFGVTWRLSLLFPAMLTTLLVWQPDGLAIPCVLASLIHEGGHLLGMCMLGVLPQNVTVGVFGAQMQMHNIKISYKQSVLISLSGPLINLMSAVALWLCQCSISAVVHLLLAIINLLPAIGLDGGEMLRCCLCQFGFGELASRILHITSALVVMPLITFGLYVLFQGESNASLLVVGAYLIAMIFFADKNEKSLDKRSFGCYNHRDE